MEKTELNLELSDGWVLMKSDGLCFSQNGEKTGLPAFVVLFSSPADAFERPPITAGGGSTLGWCCLQLCRHTWGGMELLNAEFVSGDQVQPCYLLAPWPLANCFFNLQTVIVTWILFMSSRCDEGHVSVVAKN